MFEAISIDNYARKLKREIGLKAGQTYRVFKSKGEMILVEDPTGYCGWMNRRLFVILKNPSDVREKTCSYCRQKIITPYLMINQKCFHKMCINCFNCKCLLTDKPFTKKIEGVFCKDCFKEKQLKLSKTFTMRPVRRQSTPNAAHDVKENVKLSQGKIKNNTNKNTSRRSSTQTFNNKGQNQRKRERDRQNSFYKKDEKDSSKRITKNTKDINELKTQPTRSTRGEKELNRRPIKESTRTKTPIEQEPTNDNRDKERTPINLSRIKKFPCKNARRKNLIAKEKTSSPNNDKPKNVSRKNVIVVRKNSRRQRTITKDEINAIKNFSRIYLNSPEALDQTTTKKTITKTNPKTKSASNTNTTKTFKKSDKGKISFKNEKKTDIDTVKQTSKKSNLVFKSTDENQIEFHKEEEHRAKKEAEEKRRISAFLAKQEEQKIKYKKEHAEEIRMQELQQERHRFKQEQEVNGKQKTKEKSLRRKSRSEIKKKRTKEIQSQRNEKEDLNLVYCENTCFSDSELKPSMVSSSVADVRHSEQIEICVQFNDFAEMSRVAPINIQNYKLFTSKDAEPKNDQIENAPNTKQRNSTTQISRPESKDDSKTSKKSDKEFVAQIRRRRSSAAELHRIRSLGEEKKQSDKPVIAKIPSGNPIKKEDEKNLMKQETNVRRKKSIEAEWKRIEARFESAQKRKNTQKERLERQRKTEEFFEKHSVTNKGTSSKSKGSRKNVYEEVGRIKPMTKTAKRDDGSFWGKNWFNIPFNWR